MLSFLWSSFRKVEMPTIENPNLLLKVKLQEAITNAGRNQSERKSHWNKKQQGGVLSVPQVVADWVEGGAGRRRSLSAPRILCPPFKLAHISHQLNHLLNSYLQSEQFASVCTLPIQSPPTYLYNSAKKITLRIQTDNEHNSSGLPLLASSPIGSFKLRI